MDGLDFHPYPIPQSLPFATGYPDPHDASVSNLPRIYQAFYDGFNGTPQRTIGQQRGGGLPVSLNEMGIQTTRAAQPGYTGTEVSANAGRRDDRARRDPGLPGELVHRRCWPCSPATRTSASINIFHLVDESDLAGWQSGLYFADARSPSSRPAVVSGWIAQTGGACQGKQTPWHPAVPSTTPQADEEALTQRTPVR